MSINCMIGYTNFNFRVAECVVVGAWSIGNAVAYSPNFQKGLAAAHEVFKILNRVPKIRSFSNALKNQWVKSLQFNVEYFLSHKNSRRRAQ